MLGTSLNITDYSPHPTYRRLVSFSRLRKGRYTMCVTRTATIPRLAIEEDLRSNIKHYVAARNNLIVLLSGPLTVLRNHDRTNCRTQRLNIHRIAEERPLAIRSVRYAQESHSA